MINKIGISQNKAASFKQNLNPEARSPKGKLAQFKDYFIQDTKRSMPASLAFAGIWSLIDAKRGKGKLSNVLLSNIGFFSLANAVFSAVNSAFKTNSK